MQDKTSVQPDPGRIRELHERVADILVRISDIVSGMEAAIVSAQSSERPAGPPIDAPHGD